MASNQLNQYLNDNTPVNVSLSFLKTANDVLLLVKTKLEQENETEIQNKKTISEQSKDLNLTLDDSIVYLHTKIPPADVDYSSNSLENNSKRKHSDMILGDIWQDQQSENEVVQIV